MMTQLRHTLQEFSRRLPLAIPIVVIVIAIGWLIAYIYGHCDPELLKASTAGCTDFWLNRYQTLLAGVLAFIGGSFAYLAVRFQVTEQKLKEEQRIELSVMHALSLAASDFSRAARIMSEGGVLNSEDCRLDLARLLFAQPNVIPPLMQLTILQIDRTEQSLRAFLDEAGRTSEAARGEMLKNPRHIKAAAMATTMALALDQAREHIQHARKSKEPFKGDSTHLLRRLELIGATRLDIEPLDKLFYFSETS